MDQTYSFKHKNLRTITKTRTPFCTVVFCETLPKFQSKRASRSGTGSRGTWKPMIFTYFPSSSPLKFSWHSSFNLARSTCSLYWRYISTCSLYWCYIFSFVNIFTENVNTERITSLREKCPNTELFLVRIFLYSDWIRRFTS